MLTVASLKMLLLMPPGSYAMQLLLLLWLENAEEWTGRT